jgi:acyl carrier protein
LASSGSDAAGKALAYPGIRETVDHGVQTRNDLAALVELIIESRLQVSSIQIKPEADLVRDLGADSLDLVELHVELENLVECSLIQPDRIAQKRTVGEIIDFLWEHLQQDANPLSERVFRPATCAQTVQIKKRLVREETPPTSI